MFLSQIHELLIQTLIFPVKWIKFSILYAFIIIVIINHLHTGLLVQQLQ